MRQGWVVRPLGEMNVPRPLWGKRRHQQIVVGDPLGRLAGGGWRGRERPGIGDDTGQGRCGGGLGAHEVHQVVLGARAPGEVARNGAQADPAGRRRLAHSRATVAPGLMQARPGLQEGGDVARRSEIAQRLAAGRVDIERDAIVHRPPGHDPRGDGQVAERGVGR